MNMAEDENYYELLKKQNYEALLNKEVQLDNARSRALKYTYANLSAMGLASSGYGQTALNGIENQYLSALETAEQGYNQENTNIGIQEQEYLGQKMDTDYANFAAGIAEASGRGETAFYDYFRNRGLLDEQNNFNIARAEELYGKDNALNLQDQFRYGLEDYELARTAYDYKDGKNVTITYYKNGEAHQIDLKNGQENGWNKENKTLNAAIVSGELKDGSIVLLKNAKGNNIYVKYKNGKLYYSTPQEWKKSSQKLLIQRGDGLQDVTSVYNKYPDIYD